MAFTTRGSLFDVLVVLFKKIFFFVCVLFIIRDFYQKGFCGLWPFCEDYRVERARKAARGSRTAFFPQPTVFSLLDISVSVWLLFFYAIRTVDISGRNSVRNSRLEFDKRIS